MIQKILLPKLGQTMEEATIAKWHKAEGDEVRKGEVICEITSDKATLEVESYGSGTLRRINAPEGAEVAVNEQIGVLAGPDEEIPAEVLDYVPKPAAKAEAPTLGGDTLRAEPSKVAPKVTSPGAGYPPVDPRRASPPSGDARIMSPASSPPPYEAPAAPMAGARLMITPRARKAARERDLGWRFLVGSGPGGRIRERDVLAYEKEIEGLATPAARRLAAEKHVDLRLCPPTGPGGRVCEDDVRRAEPSLVAGGFERHEMSAMRRVVATRMTWSGQSIPQFSLTVNVDMSRAATVRDRLKEEGEKVSFNDLLVKAVASALREFPDVASLYDNGTIIRRAGLHVGIAVSLDDRAAPGSQSGAGGAGRKLPGSQSGAGGAGRKLPGSQSGTGGAGRKLPGSQSGTGGAGRKLPGSSGGLIVPVVRNADRRALVDLSKAAKDLIERARSNRLTPDEYTGGVITVSNLGMLGVDEFRALVNPGESAIVACGKIRSTVVVTDDGEFVARPVMRVTGSFDHRTVDGATGARFLARVKELLEAPEGLA